MLPFEQSFQKARYDLAEIDGLLRHDREVKMFGKVEGITGDVDHLKSLHQRHFICYGS